MNKISFHYSRRSRALLELEQVHEKLLNDITDNRYHLNELLRS
jgi:uncharacterized protein YjiS (DUF1127 family)